MANIMLQNQVFHMMLIRLLITQLVTKIEGFIYSQNFILAFTIGTEEQLHAKNTISLFEQTTNQGLASN